MKKTICVIIIIFSVILVSGCWSCKEPKTLAIAESALIDMTGDGLYKMTVEIMNPAGMGGAGIQGGGGSGKNPYITITAIGKSIRESISNQLAREYTDFGAHVKARFFSERYAKNGIGSTLEVIARDRLTDENAISAVIKGNDPERIYSSMIGLSGNVGTYIENLSNFHPYNSAKGVFVSALDFIKDYYAEGKEPVCGLITLVKSNDLSSGNNEPAQQESGESTTSQSLSERYEIIYEGLAAFKDDKLVGYMDGEEAEIYNLLENKVRGAIITVPVGKDMDSAVLHISGATADIKVIVADGKAVIDITLKIPANIAQVNGNLDITEPEVLKEIEQNFNALVKEKTIAAIKKAQSEFNSDIFGFGNALHMQHPAIWRNIKNDWNDVYFTSAEINVAVKSVIVLAGEEEEPFFIKEAD